MEEHYNQEPDNEEPEPWYKGPIKYIIGIFLILLLILMIVPRYAVKLDPEPGYIPEIDEVVSINGFIERPNITISSKDDYYRFIQPSDPLIKQTADKIISKACDDSNRICHAKALFYFVRDKFDYVSDPNAFEYVKTAKESLAVRVGDCDDASVLLVSLLESIGIRTQFAFIPGHVFVRALLPEAISRYKVNGDMVNLDPTCKDCDFGQIPWKNYELIK